MYRRNSSKGYQGWSQSGVGSLADQVRRKCGGDNWWWNAEEQSQLAQSKHLRESIELPFSNTKRQYWRKKKQKATGFDHDSEVLDKICNSTDINRMEEDVEYIDTDQYEAKLHYDIFNMAIES